MDINLNLAINKESNLKIILDKNSGEYLKAAGDANLTLAVNPEGKINVLGEYLVESGEYILNMSDFLSCWGEANRYTTKMSCSTVYYRHSDIGLLIDAPTRI